MSLYMVFDVESCGLHGAGFAVGWVVVDTDAPHALADGIEVCQTTGWPLPDWVRDNVMPALPEPTVAFPDQLRTAFWNDWIQWHSQGALLAADVAWPVEARFLAACVDDGRKHREWDGPYPLIDIASVRFAKGLDPLGTVDRLPNELPEHNPLADARQSARLLLEAIRT